MTHEGDAARGGKTGHETRAEPVRVHHADRTGTEQSAERRNRLPTIESDERCADAGEVELVLCLHGSGNKDVVAVLRQPRGE